MVRVQVVIAARVRLWLSWFFVGLHGFLFVMSVTVLGLACSIKASVDDVLYELGSEHSAAFKLYVIPHAVVLMILHGIGGKMACSNRDTERRVRGAPYLKGFLVVWGLTVLFFLPGLIIIGTEPARVTSSFVVGFKQAMRRYTNGSTVTDLRKDPDLSRSIDNLQQKYTCCGNDSFKDWFMESWINTAKLDLNDPLYKSKVLRGQYFADAVPLSCCDPKEQSICEKEGSGIDWNKLAFYSKGCAELIPHRVKKKLILPLMRITVFLLVLETLALFLFRFYQTAVKLEKEWGLSEEPTPAYLFKLHFTDRITRLKNSGRGDTGNKVTVKGSKQLASVVDGPTVPLLEHEITMEDEADDDDDDFDFDDSTFDDDEELDAADASYLSEFGSQSSLGTKIVRRASQHAQMSQQELYQGAQPPMQPLNYLGQSYPAPRQYSAPKVPMPQGGLQQMSGQQPSSASMITQAKKIKQHGKGIMSGVKRLAKGDVIVKGMAKLEKNLNKVADQLHLPAQPNANKQQYQASAQMSGYQQPAKPKNLVSSMRKPATGESTVVKVIQRTDFAPAYPVQPQVRVEPPESPSVDPPYPPGLNKRVSSLGPLEETDMFRMFSGVGASAEEGQEGDDGGAAEGAEEVMGALKDGLGGLLGKKKKEKNEEDDKDTKDKEKGKDKDKDKKGKDAKDKKADKDGKNKKGKDKKDAKSKDKDKKKAKKDDKGKKEKKDNKKDQKKDKNHSKVQKKSAKGSKPAKAKKAKPATKAKPKAKPKKAKKPKMGKKRR